MNNFKKITEFQLVIFCATLFQFVFAIGAVIGISDAIHSFSFTGLFSLILMLYLSFYSYVFGMEYKIEIVQKLVDASKKDRAKDLNRRQRRKLKRSIPKMKIV